MKKKLKAIYAFSVLFLFLIFTGVYGQEKLVFSVMLARHGDRTPYSKIESEKISNQWELGIGELTPVGINQEYNLGKEIRKRYVDELKLLDNHYQYNSIYVASTDLNRTIMSAQSFLIGLYPPSTGPNLDDGNPALPCRIQPISFHTIPNGCKNIINPSCENKEKYLEYMNKYAITQKEWIKLNNEHIEDFKKWSKLLGMKINSLEDILITGDHLYCMNLYDVTPPEGLSKEESEKIIKLRWRAAALRFIPKQIAYYMASGFLEKVNNDLVNASKGVQPYKCVFYFGHDDSVLGIMSALDLPLENNPPYCAHIDFELYQNENEYSVEVRYNGKPLVLTGDKNKTRYSLPEFYRIIKPCVDFEKNKLKGNKKMKKTKFSWVASLSVVLLLGVFLVSSSAVFAAEKERVGIFFQADVYPNNDAKFSLYSGQSPMPFFMLNPNGSTDMGDYRFPAFANVEYVPVYATHFPGQANLKPWAHRFGFSKLIILNYHGGSVNRVPLFSSQSYNVILDVASYNCHTGEIIYQNSFNAGITSYPNFDARQVSGVCQSLFGNFTDSILYFLKGLEV